MIDTGTPLDLRGTYCPMAFVKTKLHLDKFSNGDITCILYENTPPNEPLVRSIQSLGHRILSRTDTAPATPLSGIAYKDKPPTNNNVQLTLLKIEVNT